MTIDGIADGRLIAGLGAGDHLNRSEQQPFGLPFPGVAERLARLEAVTTELGERGVHTWIGGRSPMVRALAGRVADGWNCWDGTELELTTFRPPEGRSFELTWGGPPPRRREPGRPPAARWPASAWRGSSTVRHRTSTGRCS